MYPLGNPDIARLAPAPWERPGLGGGKSQTRGAELSRKTDRADARQCPASAPM